MTVVVKYLSIASSLFFVLLLLFSGIGTSLEKSGIVKASPAIVLYSKIAAISLFSCLALSLLPLVTILLQRRLKALFGDLEHSIPVLSDFLQMSEFSIFAIVATFLLLAGATALFSLGPGHLKGPS